MLKIVLIVAIYLICFLIELPVCKRRSRREFTFYIMFMGIALIFSIVVSLIYDKVSLASAIEKLLKPISDKIYGS